MALQPNPAEEAPPINGAAGPSNSAAKPVFAAVAAALAAAGIDCTCQPCKMLRKAAPDLANFIFPMGDGKE